MLLNAFASTVYQHREGVSGTTTLSNVVFATPSNGWNLSAEGASSAMVATLHFKNGYSVQTPALSPLFKEGDEISLSQGADSDERFIVASVTTCYRKGIVDHYEVSLT